MVNQTLGLQELPQKAKQIQHSSIRLGCWRSCFASGLSKGSLQRNLILRCLLRDIFGRLDASKTEVICAGIDLAFAARSNDIT
jgi:hypothetical protein